MLRLLVSPILVGCLVTPKTQDFLARHQIANNNRRFPLEIPTQALSLLKNRQLVQVLPPVGSLAIQRRTLQHQVVSLGAIPTQTTITPRHQVAYSGLPRRILRLVPLVAYSAQIMVLQVVFLELQIITQTLLGQDSGLQTQEQGLVLQILMEVCLG